jgi:MATE family multidrug resistance protein
MISLMLARALSMGLVFLHFNRQGRWFRDKKSR